MLECVFQLLETKAGAEWRQSKVETSIFFTSKEVANVIEQVEVRIWLPKCHPEPSCCFDEAEQHTDLVPAVDPDYTFLFSFKYCFTK